MSYTMKVKAVIPASGMGTRFGGDVPKQFLRLDGEPVLKRTIAVFDGSEIVSEIAAAVPESFSAEVEAYGFKKLRHIVTGENSRAESVYAALKRLEGDTNTVILIHDGIRPFVTDDLIKAVAEAAFKHGAAVACSPVTDTIKQSDGAGIIRATKDRSGLWRAQTPQGFTYDIIARAYARAEADGCLSQATDDSALAERLGIHVRIVAASPANIKITTPEDLIIARAFLEAGIVGDV